MDIVSETRAREASTPSLLNAAVHRHRAVSLAGFNERLFTLAFSGLVYPQIWEDPEVDAEAMELEPGHHVVAIASGGCNILSYLAAAPVRVTAVDLNMNHVALLRLKLAALRALPDWESLHALFGARRHPGRLALARGLLDHLDETTRDFWLARGAGGRRRISLFKGDIYRRGLLGRFIGLGHLLARLHGVDMAGLMRARDLSEQRAWFDAHVAPLFDRPLVRWLTQRRFALFGLGIPPEQYRALCGGDDGAMAAVLRQRLRRLACDFPLSRNYFAWQAFARRYGEPGREALPPYLEPANHASVRAGADRVDVRHASMTDVLAAMPAGSVDRFVFLDAQDWMSDAQLAALWQQVGRAAAPGARVIYRTAGTTCILPGRVPAALLGAWRYEEARSRELGARDRSAVYGGFHLHVLR